MKKMIPLLVWIMLLAYACAAPVEPAAPTAIPSPTATQIATQTPAASPTPEPPPTATAEALKYFPGAAYTEEMWAQAPVLGETEIQKIKDYFQDPAHQTLKPENVSEYGGVNVLGVDGSKRFTYVAFNATVGESILPVGSYVAENNTRHVVCELVVNGKVQIVDITARSMLKDVDLLMLERLSPDNTGEPLHIRILLDVSEGSNAPPRANDYVRALAALFTEEQIAAFKNQEFPDISNIPTLVFETLHLVFHE